MIPQAYTARDIGEAYKWIQTLPPHQRDELKTMEQMVLSYLKAKSMGALNNFQAEVQAKKSAEFQKTLQNLKVEMDQFGPSATIAQQNTTQNVSQSVSHSTVSHSVSHNSTTGTTMGTGGLGATSAYTASPMSHQPLNEQVITEPLPLSQPTNHLFGAMKLDPKSRQILVEIREGLNLSSDAEVIRMCLVIAHKSIRNLIDT